MRRTEAELFIVSAVLGWAALQQVSWQQQRLCLSPLCSRTPAGSKQPHADEGLKSAATLSGT